MKYTSTLEDQKFEIDIEETVGKLSVRMNGKPVNVDFIRLAEGIDYSMLLGNISYQMSIEETAGIYQVHFRGQTYFVTVQSERERRSETVISEKVSKAGIEEVKAPMPGLVVEVEVKEGDAVSKGSGLVIVEAMKMENELKSPGDGVIKEVRVRKGDTVEKEQVLVVIG